MIESVSPDLVMTDFRLGDITGTELLTAIKAKRPHLPVLVITGYSDIKIAVNVMKLGAYDYITKPLFPDEILITVNKAIADAESASDDNHDYVSGEVSTVEAVKPSRKKFFPYESGLCDGRERRFRQSFPSGGPGSADKL